MEQRARRSIQALQQMEINKVNVIRDDYVAEIDARNLVPGDLIYLEAGDMVPADGRLISVQQLQCNEAALTGESQPVLKDIAVLTKETMLAEQINMIFKGTAVLNGNGSAIVTATGSGTQLGQVTSMISRAATKQLTPLHQKLNHLTIQLLWGTLGVAILFIWLQTLRGGRIAFVVETAAALAVAAIPEGLPVVATVALASGALALARRNAIVKRLSAVETLGGTTIILTDKTGTLTENKISVSMLTFPEEKLSITPNVSITKLEKSKLHLEKLLLAAVLCNNAHDKGRSTADPLEKALLSFAKRQAQDVTAIRSHYTRITEIPFSSGTRMMITLHQTPEGYITAAKGAPEQLLKACDRMITESGLRPLTPDDRRHLLHQAAAMAKDGLRVLAFAWKDDIPAGHNGFEQALIFTGLVGFLDPPRGDIKAEVARCQKAGIRVVMITGDHPHTALHIAQKIGLTGANETTVINGATLPSLNSMPANWKKKIRRSVVFARTTPRQKLEIAAVFQEAGEIVAMTGDGINDAPALEKADIGIAMGLRGTQVAREAADMVLKDDAFSSITAAISQGRAIFRNIQKFIIYLMSCNLTEVLTVTVLGTLQPQAVLLPLQILFLNVVTDVFPALALGLGKADGQLLLRPPRDPRKPLIQGRQWVQVITYALLMTLIIAVAVEICKYFGESGSTLNHVAFFALAFAQLSHVFNMREADAHPFHNEITNNKFIWAALLLCGLMMTATISLPALGRLLAVTHLPARCWLTVIAAGLLPSVLPLSLKWIIRKPARP